jgi:hypothetical protein
MAVAHRIKDLNGNKGEIPLAIGIEVFRRHSLELSFASGVKFDDFEAERWAGSWQLIVVSLLHCG